MNTNLKIVVVTVVFASILLLTGCPKDAKLDLSSKTTKDMAVEQMRANLFKSEVHEYYCLRLGKKWTNVYGQDNIPTSAQCTNLAAGDPTDTEAMAKEVRNRTFQRGRGIIDEIYFKYSNGIRRNRSITDFILDLVDISTSTALGLTKGTAGTLRDMGIALTGLRGGRSAYNLRMYDEQTTEVILDQMDLSRNEVRLAYENNSRNRPTSQYSIDDVFSDLYRYFAVGSQTEAFKRIRRTTAVKAELAESAILKLESVSPELAYFPPADTIGLPSGLENMVFEFRKRENMSRVVAGDAGAVLADKNAKRQEINQKLDAIFNELKAPGTNLITMQAFLDAAKNGPPDLTNIFDNFTTPDANGDPTAEGKIGFMTAVRKAIAAARRGNESDPAANAALKLMHGAFTKNQLK